MSATFVAGKVCGHTPKFNGPVVDLRLLDPSIRVGGLFGKTVPAGHPTRSGFFARSPCRVCCRNE